MKISKAKTLLVLAAAVAGLTSFMQPASAFYGMGGGRGYSNVGYGYGGYGYNGYGDYYGGAYAAPVNDFGGAFASPVGFNEGLAGFGCGPCGSLRLRDWDQPYEFFRH